MFRAHLVRLGHKGSRPKRKGFTEVSIKYLAQAEKPLFMTEYIMVWLFIYID